MAASRESDATAFLERLERLAAIAQNGLTFAKDRYDIQRYEQLRAIVADMIAEVTTLDPPLVRGWLDVRQGYATPSFDVRAVVLRGTSILLVQESVDGRWALPGGWADINSSPRESVEREVLEEAGLSVVAVRLLALCDKQKRDYPPQMPHAYKCFILCEERGGDLVQGTDETDAAAFFELAHLPALSEHRVTRQQLLDVVALARDPRAPVEFD